MHVLASLALLGWVLAGEAAATPSSHTRLATPHGPLHVLLPAESESSAASVVVYVHGYFTDVDRAWRQHALPAQFEASRQHAIFVACAAPSNHRQPVRWRSLGDVLATVAARLDIELPPRTIVIGHSGAHRTMSSWLANERDARAIDTLVLVDAHYGTLPQYRDWIEADSTRRLIDIAIETRPWTDALHAQLPETLAFDELPTDDTLAAARAARIVYIRTSIDHMELVTSGAVLPRLLAIAGASEVRSEQP